MKRGLALLLLCAMLLALCTGCGSNQDNAALPASAQEASFGSDLRGEGGAQIFAREAIELPQIGLYAQKAVKFNDNEIVIYCQNSEREASFFSLDTSTLSVEALNISIPASVIDIDSAGGGDLSLLTMDEEGAYSIWRVAPDLSAEEIAVTGEGVDEESVFWKLCACENGYLLDDIDKVAAVDQSGNIIKTLGPYRGGIYFAHTPDGGGMVISLVAGETGAKVQMLDKSFNITDTFVLKNGYSDFYDSGTQELFAFSSGIIYRLNVAADERTGFCNAQASGGGNNNFIYLSEDRFFSIQNGKPFLWTPSDAEGITVLRLATYGMGHELSVAVSGFNERSDQYKIDVVDYSVYDEAGDSYLGLTRLSTDIISGDTPDIYDLGYLPARSFAAKGLFQDFSPFLEEDPSISYSDLIPSVARSMEADGGMYYLIPAFRIHTMYGDGETIGYKADWTVEDFLALTEKYSARQLLGTGMTRSKFLQNLLIFNGEQYVDYREGNCNFTDPEFIRLLDFIAALPEEEIEDDSSEEARGYFGEQLLITAIFQELIDELAIDDAIYHGKTAYVGFPSSSGSGVKMAPVLRLAMSSTAVSQEGVWEFFSYLLSGEYQNMVMSKEGVPVEGAWIMQGIPAVSEYFNARLDRWIEIANKWPVALGTVSEGSMFEISTEPANERTRETAVSPVNRINGISELDSSIYTIVVGEAAKFFAGNRTAEETAAAIQSRASIYMAEQYG